MINNTTYNDPTIKTPQNGKVCPNCGAISFSETCPHCGIYIGEAATEDLSANYPILDCQSAKISRTGTIFPFITAFGVLFFSFMIMIVYSQSPKTGEIKFFLCFSIILLFIGIGFLIYTILNIKRAILNALRGTDYDGIFYGYDKTNSSVNGLNFLKGKVIINTPEGKKLVILPLDTTAKIYKVNSRVRVRIYKFTACMLKDDYNW